MKKLSSLRIANNNAKNQMTSFFNFLFLMVMAFAFFTSCQKESMEEMDIEMESNTEITDNMDIGITNDTNLDAEKDSIIGDVYNQKITTELLEKAQAKLEAIIAKDVGKELVEATVFTEEGANTTATSRSNQTTPFYTIKSRIAGHKLDVSGGRLGNNIPIWQYTPNQTAAQSWSFRSTGDGYYYIRSKVSGKYLTVHNGSKDAKAPVVQHEYKSSLRYAQQWKLVSSNTPGYQYYVNRNSGMVLDVKYASDKNGTILWQYPFNGTIAQKFKFNSTTYEKARYSKTYGGTGGGSFSLSPPGGLINIKKISRVFIRHGKYVDAVQVEWELMDGKKVWSKRGGGTGGKGTMINLASDEYIITVKGKAGRFVNSLQFVTNKGKTYGRYGSTGGAAFNITIQSGIKGFFGKSGWYLDKVGVIY